MCDCEQVAGLLTEIRDLLAAQSPSASSPADGRPEQFPELPDPVVVTGD